MTALILAAGFGSRLMPLTEKRPKCLVRYQRKPILDYEIEALRNAGIEKIYIVGGYLASVLIAHVQKLGIKRVFENPNYDSSNMVETLFAHANCSKSCTTRAKICWFRMRILSMKNPLSARC